MVKVLIAAAAAVVLGSLAGSAGAGARAGSSCDEACLKGWMDGYLQALADNDPGRLPVAPNLKYTENGATINLGEAIWVTFNRVGKYRQDFYDTETGGVASYLDMVERIDQPGLYSVRLKVRGGRITEIETIVSRGNRNGDVMANVDPSWTEAWSRKEPVGTRLNRQQLIDASMKYMKSITWHDGKIGNFHDDCQRVENGGITAIAPNGKPVIPLRGGGPGGPPAGQGQAGAAGGGANPTGPAQPPRPDFIRMGCAPQIDALFVSFIQGFHSAHIDMVDVERQVTFGTFDFMRRGHILSYTYNGQRIPTGANANAPGEGLNSEAWKFVDGKIYRVAAVFPAVQTYKRGNGWPGTAPEMRPVDDTVGGRIELYLRPVNKKAWVDPARR